MGAVPRVEKCKHSAAALTLTDCTLPYCMYYLCVQVVSTVVYPGICAITHDRGSEKIML